MKLIWRKGKGKYEKERCDTRCVIMRWSNSEVQLRQ